MVTVLVPAVLQPRTRGCKTLQSPASTLGELLDRLADEYADFVAVIREGTGLSRFVNVYRNGENVRHCGGLDAALSDGDEIFVLPAVAGG